MVKIFLFLFNKVKVTLKALFLGGLIGFWNRKAYGLASSNQREVSTLTRTQLHDKASSPAFSSDRRCCWFHWQNGCVYTGRKWKTPLILTRKIGSLICDQEGHWEGAGVTPSGEWGAPVLWFSCFGARKRKKDPPYSMGFQGVELALLC